MMNGGTIDSFEPKKPEYTPPQINKPKYEIEKRDLVFSLLCLIISILTVILVFWGGFKIGFTVSYILLFTVMSLFLYNKEHKPDSFSSVCGALSVISAFVYGYSGNSSVNTYLFIVMFFLSALWFASLCGSKDNGKEFGTVTLSFATVFGESLGNVDKACRSLLDSKNERLKAFSKAFIGILCALPALVIIIPLLASADGAFEGLLEYVGENIGELVLQVIIGAVLAPFVISYGLGMRKNERKPKEEKDIKGLENVYIVSFLSVLAFVYVAYLFSQLAYFFDAFKGILPDEFIPSAYARRGFFEMSIISGINFVIIYCALIFKNKEKDSKAVSAISTFIILFTLFLISAAIAKMILYIQNFGMTVLRLTTSGFMVFLAVVFIALMFRCFNKKTPVLKTAFIAATCVLLIFGFGNVNRVVADYNVYAYKMGHLQSIDISTLVKQGTSGVPALYDVYKNLPEYRADARKKLENMYEKVYSKEREIGDWNLTDQIAYDILEKFGEELKLNK